MSSAAPLFPRVHTLVICDDIEEGSEEGVYNLLGVRWSLSVPFVPCLIPQLCVYVQATAHEGIAVCRLQLIHASEEEPIAIAPLREIEFHGPLDPVAIAWEIPDCEFYTEGLHYIQVYFNDRLGGERMLHITTTGLTNGQAPG